MTPKEFSEQFHITLNAQQMEAVQTIDGPVLLLAVPGSGKTTVLVTRLGYMLYGCGIDPASILMLTYTRAATRDMAERFYALFGNEFANRLEFRTINSICDRVIRYYSARAGKTPFQLESDEKRLGQIVSAAWQQAEKSYPTENDIKTARTLITYIKNMRLGQADMDVLGMQNDINISEIFRIYRSIMRQQSRMDYDDQMVYAYNILAASPETRQVFQQKYRYICVDEAQDTSRIQHDIIALLAAGHENLFMVGDEDQSIYGFRAAYPKALLEFETMHPGARVLLMEQNYRSDARIVEAADRLIQKNQQRHKKTMKSSRPAKAAVREISVKGRRAQYTYLLKVAQGSSMPKTAVLYRNNESMIPLADILERNHVPYRMQSRELLFFTHRTVLDVRNIIEFAAHPANSDLFLQIYYKIGLYINKNEAELACRKSRQKGIPVLDALEEYCGISSFKAIKVRAARTNLKRMLEEPATRAIGRILKALEYSDYLERSGISDEKLDILKILASSPAPSIGTGEEPSVSMSPLQLLKRLDWLAERLRSRQEDPDCPFILSTIHSSKGLEYENVYLIDCADGIFPRAVPEDPKNEEEMAAFEEERRMYYVAATRARDQLTIFSLPAGCTFTDELLGRESESSSAHQNSELGLETSFGRKNASGRGETSAAAASLQPKQDTLSKTKSAPKTAADFERFKEQLGEGIPVSHKRFGDGVISQMDEHSVTIQFFEAGERTFNLRILFEKDLLTYNR